MLKIANVATYNRICERFETEVRGQYCVGDMQYNILEFEIILKTVCYEREANLQIGRCPSSNSIHARNFHCRHTNAVDY